MAREIKFRAWSTRIKNMIDLKKITPLALNTDTNGIFIPLSDDFHIMQFTGLKDKNGIDIYEGDIVEAVFNHHGLPTDTSFNAKIIYNDNIGSFQISYLNINDQFVNDTIHLKYFLKVIGNVFENPELLK